MEVDKIRKQLDLLKDDLHDLMYRVEGICELIDDPKPFDLDALAQEAMDNVDDVIWSSYQRNRNEFAIMCERRTRVLFPQCVIPKLNEETSMFTPGKVYSSGDVIKKGLQQFVCAGSGGSGGGSGNLVVYPFGGSAIATMALGYGEGGQ